MPVIAVHVAMPIDERGVRLRHLAVMRDARVADLVAATDSLA